MKNLELVSEAVSPAGSFQGGGVTRLLGTPQMDDLTLLVRESVQNSWDARLPVNSIGTIDFAIKIWTLSDKQRSAILRVFSELPSSGSPLEKVLASENILVGEVSDWGTVGLSGPTRADVATSEKKNFVNFIRNIGAPQTATASGGTYGFGKGSYYRASNANAIVAYTRCVQSNGKIESRLIAAAVGEQFTKRSVPYTGRHFWGVSKKDYVEPLIGREADKLALALGMSLPPEMTGTSILIVGFRTGFDADADEDASPRTPRQACELISHQFLWQCWPKMIERNGVVPMRFHVECENEAIPLPAIHQIPSLRSFAKCLGMIHKSDPDVVQLRAQRPRTRLGSLAFNTYSSSNPGLGFGTEALAGFHIPTHHVALLRGPELIVTYSPGPAHVLEDHGWSGVFLADPSVDHSFASAEPPTHDAWVKGQVPERWQRTIVSVALRDIASNAKARFSPIAASHGADDGAVADLALALGNVFLLPGRGGSRPAGSTPSGKKPKGSVGGHTTNLVDQLSGRLAVVEGVPSHVVEVDMAAAAKFAALEARVGVVVDSGSRETEAPLDSPLPRVVGWLVDEDHFFEGPLFRLTGPIRKLEVAIESFWNVVPTVEVGPLNESH